MKRFYDFFIQKAQKYYSENPKIGRGDFFTSPELDEAFGKSIGHFLQDYLEIFDNPKILELGAGNGIMAKDILEMLDIPYIIYEVSPYLTNVQKNLLNNKNVIWTSSLEELEPFEGIILSNEFFDALGIAPVKDKKELYIDGLKEVWQEPCNDTKKFINIFNIDDNYYELPLDTFYIYEKLSKILKKGYMLTIDYGYKTSPHKNTIIGYKDSKIVKNIYTEDTFDITYMVDFSMLQRIGEYFGLKNMFLKKQRDFLIEIPYFVAILEEVCQEEDAYSIERCSRLKNLILSMGDSFYVLFQQKL
ncbi:SAM-dependent methyltransferase [Hydrogenobaculum acidophilum]